MIAEETPPQEELATRPWHRPRLTRMRRLRRREARRGTKCLNCETNTEARYCPECGQENVDVNISVWEIFREAVEEFVRFDSKLVRTLVPLVSKPGQLTQEWAAGRRTRYLSPLKLYLTITAIFFLILSLISTGNMVGGSAKLQPPTNRAAVRNTYKELPEPLRFIVLQLEKLDHGVDNRELKDQFMSHAPTALFVMLPAFAGALWLLYIRNRRFYVEHLVFALHCHAYYFLVLVALTAIPTGHGFTWGRIVAGLVLATTPIYSLIALKVNYKQGWGKTILKSFMLSWAYMVLLAVTIFGCLIVAAANVPDPWDALPAATDSKQKKPSPKNERPREKSSTSFNATF